MCVKVLLPACLVLTECLSLVAHAQEQLEGHPYRLSLAITKRHITIHGKSTRITTFNDSYPGPPIRLIAGQLYLINVTNAMNDENTTVHWHGLSQRLNPAADGTHLSQWPIAPGKWFEYELRPQEEDVGTRFYHSHTDLQSVTANGPLMVDGSGANRLPWQYDDQRIMLLADWYHEAEWMIKQGLWAVPFVWPGSANAVTVNGKIFTGNSTYQGMEEPYVIDVDFDKVYFLRWIGAQALMYYAISIPDHEQTLVEVDGSWIKPHKVDVLEVASGQRYGTLIHTKPRAEVMHTVDGIRSSLQGCYWIRIESQWRTAATNGWFLLRYPGAQGCVPGRYVPPTKNNSLALIPPSCFGWVSQALEPLAGDNGQPRRSVPTDDQVARRLIIKTQQTYRDEHNKEIVWREAGVFYNESAHARAPILIQLFQGLTERPSYERAMSNQIRQGWDEVSQTYVAKAGEVLDIVIVNEPSSLSSQVELHPWHFHGLKFWHLASGVGTFSDAALAEVRSKGYRNPILRDTVVVWPEPGSSLNASDKLLPTQSGGWTALRYEVSRDEAGVWPLHCHILLHLLMGMSTTFVFDPDDIAGQYQGDPAYMVYGSNVRSPYSFSSTTDDAMGSLRA